MKLFHPFTVSTFIGLASVSALLAAPKWEEMDYGRFLSHTINNAQGKTTFDQKGCAANKGIAIKLGQNNEATMVFDTDLLRMAGGWTGGFLKLKGVVFDGAHGPNPQPADGAKMVFQTNVGPGWSKGGDFKDPRKVPTGPGAAKVPLGPLPKEWAKYRGLYLNGDNVVLAYTVNTAPVLELPGTEKAADQTVLTRTFNVLGKGEASKLLVAEAMEGASLAEQNNVIVLNDDPKNPDSRVAIAVVGAPKEAKWEVEGSRAHLSLPAFAGNEQFKVVYWKGTQADFAKFDAALKAVEAPRELKSLTQGGKQHWTQDVETQGVLGKDEGPFTVDNVTIPTENPYKSWIRVGGLDFFKDGRMAFSTWSGDVWIGEGINQDLSKIKWHRYATGLFHALGLKIVNDELYVLGRDQITHLHDLNKDGEADLYENFNNDVQVTPGFHEFAFDLQTDPQGNFYFSKGGPVNPGGSGWGPLSEHNGCIFKLSKDGQNLEVFATGVRAPNGLGVGPNGEISIGDNQGTWVPVDYIHFPKKGDFVGVPDLAHRDPIPTSYDPHLCWIPYDVDNSCGSHVWVTSDQWGPFKGEMLYLSYGKSSLFKVLKETVQGTIQGGLVKFPLKFETGIMRARFNPNDGQLYVGGLKGWQTNGAKDGAIHRVRYTGKQVTMQTGLNVTDKGIRITFTNPVDKATAGDVQNYSIQQNNYRWTKNYGSPEYKVSNPEEKGRDDVPVKSVTVSEDGKSVFLEVENLQPVMTMRIKMNIKGADGSQLPGEITHTINLVPKTGAATAAR
ncbi:DUF6797 domain-containing protein [Verrucomicrobiota bacterium sgz303538]